MKKDWKFIDTADTKYFSWRSKGSDPAIYLVEIPKSKIFFSLEILGFSFFLIQDFQGNNKDLLLLDLLTGRNGQRIPLLKSLEVTEEVAKEAVNGMLAMMKRIAGQKGITPKELLKQMIEKYLKELDEKKKITKIVTMKEYKKICGGK